MVTFCFPETEEMGDVTFLGGMVVFLHMVPWSIFLSICCFLEARVTKSLFHPEANPLPFHHDLMHV